MTATTKPILYRPVERHWYRLADAVQYPWHRFAATRTGRFTVFVATRSGRFTVWLVPRVLRLLVRVLTYTIVAAMIVGSLVLYTGLSLALGKRSRSRR